MNIVDETQNRVNAILTTGKRKQEYLALYEIYYPLKESQPAIYGMVVATVCHRLLKLGINPEYLLILSKTWRL